jgi:glyoxalase family protein
MSATTAQPINGVHHFTAVTGDAPGNVHFYTRTLGMRFLLKTVNQDDLSAYHLFYGDAGAQPGSELTFFDWPRSIRNRPGTSTISALGLRVRSGTLDWWAQHLTGHGVQHEGIAQRGGRPTLAFADPEGQRLMLIEDGPDPAGVPWHSSEVAAEHGIHGLGHPTLTVARAHSTAQVLTDVLGYNAAGTYTAPEDGLPVQVFSLGRDGAQFEVHVAERPSMPYGQLGLGGVHHIAYRVANDEQLDAWQKKVAAAGLRPTSIINRHYFHSVYFRIPAAILFEIATDTPGIAHVEPMDHLAERLSLPSFLEAQRADIEANLVPLPSMSA